jgi:hypothetical protein
LLAAFSAAFAQTSIIGGSGVTIVNGNPNSNADLADQDLRYEAGIALDTTNNLLYIYRHDAAPGSKWVDYSAVVSSDTDTRLNNFTYSGGKIRWDVYNVKTSSVISSDSLDISAVNTDAQNLTFTGASSPFTLDISGGTDVTIASGTGITLSMSTNELTVTNSAPDQTVSISGTGITVGGTYPSFTLTATDQSVTNEAQTISSSAVSASASNLTLNQVGGAGGGTVAVSGAGGVVLTGGANTLTFGTSAVTAKNFADANTQGVVVGGYFYASQDNTMGLTPGSYVRRMF